MKRALFIGRWQPLHPGHQWLFNQKLEQGIPILIAVRDTPVNDSNPFATEDVIANLEKEYSEEVESGMVKVISIPDIESIFFTGEPLHYGAVVIEGNRIVATRVALPKSEQSYIPRCYGHRRRSAVSSYGKIDTTPVSVSGA